VSKICQKNVEDGPPVFAPDYSDNSFSSQNVSFLMGILCILDFYGLHGHRSQGYYKNYK
jgi:hypothetical protein